MRDASIALSKLVCRLIDGEDKEGRSARLCELLAPGPASQKKLAGTCFEGELRAFNFSGFSIDQCLFRDVEFRNPFGFNNENAFCSRSIASENLHDFPVNRNVTDAVKTSGSLSASSMLAA